MDIPGFGEWEAEGSAPPHLPRNERKAGEEAEERMEEQISPGCKNPLKP